MLNRSRFALILIVILLLACTGGETGNKKLKTVIVKLKNIPFEVELAITDKEQSLGLMYRKTLGDRQGMLFVYKEYSSGAYWMKNVPIPLSIAFIGYDGKILDIQDMKPFSEKKVIPAASYLYTLEVKQGVFEQIGVKEGDYLEFPPGFK